MIRYNTDNAKMEVYQAGAWNTLVASTSTSGAVDTYLGTATSATAPSRSDDVTTGLYSSTATSIGMAIGGSQAFHVDTTNAAQGYQALYNNTTGTYNVGIGSYALYTNSTGSQNVGLGTQALYQTTGNNNTSVGYQTLYSNTTGVNNLALGHQVGSTTLSTGSNNILIGTSVAVTTPAADTSSFLNIGNVINADIANERVGLNLGTTLPSYPLEVGSTSSDGNGAHLTTAGVWTSTSDRRVKENIREVPYGMDTLMKLKPVAYEMKGTHEKQIGFIAQDVAEYVPEVVSISDSGRYGLAYGNMNAVIVKAIQEMKEANDNDLAALRSENEQLRTELKSLRSGGAVVTSDDDTRELLMLTIKIGGGVGGVLLLGLTACGIALYRLRRKQAA
jgi:hypothetical protein